MPISPSSSHGALFTATTRLTDAAILALDTTPVTLVAGVGGYALMPLQVCLTVIPGGATYNGVYELKVFVGPTFGGSGWGGSPFVQSNTFNAGGAILGQFVGAQGAFYNDQEPVNLLDGQPLRCSTTAAVTGGDGTGRAILSTVYTLVSVA